MPARTGSELVVRRAARRIGLQAAALVAAVVLTLVALAVVITSRQQDDADHQLMADAAAQADDVIDPPPHCWLVLRNASGTVSSPGVPAGVPEPATFTGERELHLPGGHFLAYSQQKGTSTVEVVLDLGPSDARRRALLAELGLTAAAGLLLAGVVGLLLARRVLAPLRRTMDLQRRFIADASHELRAPLTLLHTRAQLLEQELTDSPEPVRAEVAGVVRDSDRLAELIDDLLLAASPLPATLPTDVALVPLAADAVAAARPHAGSRGVEVTLVAPDLAAVHVSGWASALHRALVALIDNAIEHTPAGGRITVTARTTGQHAELVVEDTGSGFDPAQATRLTDRFHSGGHGTGRRRHGLGLALVSDIADRHGGELHATSIPGRGATFTLSLPAIHPAPRIRTAAGRIRASIARRREFRNQ